MTSKDGNHLIGGRETDTQGLTNGPSGGTGDDDIFFFSFVSARTSFLFLQKQNSAQSYIPQGYLPPYKAVQRA
jgi:hypothetical protein